MSKVQFPAYAWLARNSAEADKYPGRWIAVVEGKILGSARSLKALMQMDEVKKASSPLFTKVPRPEEAFSLL